MKGSSTMVAQDQHLQPLPKEMYEADSFMAGRVLMKTITLVALGLLFTLYMPAVFTPFCVVLIGVGMSALYLVGYECSNSSFFKSKEANFVGRLVAWIPLLTWMEGDWFGYWAAGISALVLAMSLTAYFGFEKFITGFLKYWVLPAVVMRMNLRKLLSQKEAAALLLFPEVDDSDIIESLKNVPFYKLDKAFELLGVSSVSQMSAQVTHSSPVVSLQTILANIWESICSLIPSHHLMCELLFWRKRDILLEVVLGLCIALVPLHYYGLIPIESFFVPFVLFLAGFATRATPSLLHRSLFDGLRIAKEYMVCVFNDMKAFSTQLHVFNISYLGFVHLWAFIGLFTAVPYASYKTHLFCFFLHTLFGLGITAGAHRLWSHRSYKAHWSVETFLMLCNCGANQGSVWHWSRDHRVHHRYSDTEQDPHNSENGIFYSHCGWLFLKKPKIVLEAGRNIDMSDLQANPVVMFQKKWYLPLSMFICFILPSSIPYLCWGEDFMVALTMAYVRYVVTLNATWCVNSLAHFYGMRPYRPDSPTSENWFVSVVALGEGWHNYHHAYPWDYSTSEFGVSSQFNPSRVVIDMFALLGLVTGRKRADHVGKKTREKIESQRLQEVTCE